MLVCTVDCFIDYSVINLVCLAKPLACSVDTLSDCVNIIIHQIFVVCVIA